jgi:hypothetical protein
MTSGLIENREKNSLKRNFVDLTIAMKESDQV